MKFYLCILCFIPFFLYGSEQNNEQYAFKDIGNGRIYYKKDLGRIPTLCFHKIGDEERYAITPKNFEEFLTYLKSNKFYLLSDEEYINKDFSMVPTGYKPIVMGSDDASEGNFLYETEGSSETGKVVGWESNPILKDDSMVYLLEKHVEPVNGRINFTFYVSFNGIPFRQTGGYGFKGEAYLGNPIVKSKFNYLLDNFILGNHTFSHPITKDTSAIDFKKDLDHFYNIMESYLGERISEISTLAYPYGCHKLGSEMEKMIRNYKYKNVKIIGAFDFDGYFANSPFSGTVNMYDISRIGVDNKNIQKMYYFLENIELFESKRVFRVNRKAGLEKFNINENDEVEDLGWKLL